MQVRSSGIGKELARQAAREGAHVICWARTESALIQLCEEIRAAGGKADYCLCDVSKLENIRQAAAQTRNLAPHGVYVSALYLSRLLIYLSLPRQIVVGNAGLVDVCPFEEQSEDLIQKTVDVNFMVPHPHNYYIDSRITATTCDCN